VASERKRIQKEKAAHLENPIAKDRKENRGI
jgi:hypothetical protein